MTKRLLSILLKIAISISLIYYVLHSIGPGWGKCGSQMAAAFRDGYGWLMAGVVVEILAFLISSLRWKTILRGHDLGIGLGEAFRLVLVGFFFGQFLPGGVASGDLVRSYYIAGRSSEKKTEAVSTIVLDRVMGLWGLVTLVTASLLVGGEKLGRCFMLIGIAAAVAVGAIFFFTKGFLRRLRFPKWICGRVPWKGTFARVYEAFRHYGEHRAGMIACWGESVAVQFLMVVTAYCVGRSVGVEARAFDYLVRIPLVGAVAAIPISIGNIGTAEAAYRVFFVAGEHPAGYGSVVLAFALMMRLLWLFIGAVGGIIWWGERGKVPTGLPRQQNDSARDVSEERSGA